MVPRRLATYAALILLPGCCCVQCGDTLHGNSESGRLHLTGASNPSSYRWKGMLAEGGEATVGVKDAEFWGDHLPADVKAAKMHDDGVAAVRAHGAGFVRVGGLREGTTQLELTAIADEDEVVDSGEIEVWKHDLVRLSPACPSDSALWRGMPAMIGYALLRDSKPLSGERYFPVTVSDAAMKPIPKHSGAYLWAFEPPVADEVRLRGTIPDGVKPGFNPDPELVLPVRDPPKIAGIGFHSGGGNVATLSLDEGLETIVRVYPVGEDHVHMCNTVVGARVEAVESRCLVRSAGDTVDFGTSAQSEFGEFVVLARETGACVLKFALVAVAGAVLVDEATKPARELPVTVELPAASSGGSWDD